MKRNIFINLLVVVFIVSTIFILSSALNAQEKALKLRFSNFFPPAHANSKLSEEWCKEVENRTNGREAITYYPGSTLAPAPKLMTPL